MAKTKLTEKFLIAAKEVIDDDINAIIFSNQELIDEINYKLDEPEQISERTFQRWVNEKTQENADFVTLIKKARYNQKKGLLKELRKETSGWQRFAWILERKFTEYNLKTISEISHKIEPITININLNK